MPTTLFLQIVTISADLIIFVFVGFYLWSLTHDKKRLEEKEKELKNQKDKIDTDYRQIIDNAHSQERKILDDAAKQAGSIITGAQYVSSSSKEIIDNALQKMITDIQKEASASSGNYMNNYKSSLNQISENSLNDFQNVAKKFETELETKMQEFRDSLLPNLQKELEEYKLKRFEEAEKTINLIIQRVSQKVLNKTIPPEDHKNLIIESLEKSRKEGIFD